MRKQNDKSRLGLWILLALLILALLVMGVLAVKHHGDSNETQNTTAVTTSSVVQDDSSAGTTQADVTYDTIDAGDADDNTASDGKNVTMECKVKAIDADAIGYFDLEPLDDSSETIACYIPDGTDENLIVLANSLSVGQTVTVSGQLVEDDSLGSGVTRFNVESLNKN